MRQFVALLGAAALSVSVANAADMPEKMPSKAPMMAAPVYNWNGLYVGGVVGIVSNFSPLWSNGVPAFDVTLNGSSSAAAGGTLGYNWQVAPWLLGVEGDWSWTNYSSSSTLGGCRGNTCTTTLRNFGTARARAGYLVMPSLLIFGTGGFAWANTHNTLTTSDVSSNANGWVLGGGAEWMLAPHWTVKAEYLRLNLNNVLACAVCTPIVTASHLNANVFRGGVNYLFNWP